MVRQRANDLDFNNDSVSNTTNNKEIAVSLYEYRCNECESIFEELVPSGTKEFPCPECGRIARKIMSQCTFQLKGKGWSRDGYDKNKLSEAEKIGRIGDG